MKRIRVNIAAQVLDLDERELKQLYSLGIFKVTTEEYCSSDRPELLTSIYEEISHRSSKRLNWLINNNYNITIEEFISIYTVCDFLSIAGASINCYIEIAKAFAEKGYIWNYKAYRHYCTV